MNSRPHHSPQLTAAQVADEFGFTARHWIRLAAQGRIPGACQPSGHGGQWQFDEKQFRKWRKSREREVTAWPGFIAEAKSIGVAPSVQVGSTGEASRHQIGQLLKSALERGSKNSKASNGATGRRGHSLKEAPPSSSSEHLVTLKPKARHALHGEPCESDFVFRGSPAAAQDQPRRSCRSSRRPAGRMA
jgi:hypothetical protein